MRLAVNGELIDEGNDLVLILADGGDQFFRRIQLLARDGHLAEKINRQRAAHHNERDQQGENLIAEGGDFSVRGGGRRIGGIEVRGIHFGTHKVMLNGWRVWTGATGAAG